MSQIWIYDHNLKKKDIIETDVKVKVFDCITPQKTTFEIVKNNNIEASDIILIKDKTDYLGIIDEISQGNTSEVSIYPIEHIFENDLTIDNLDGTVDIVTYLKNQINRNFVNIDDPFMKLPFIYENTLNNAITYKTIIDTSNFLDIINDIYLNTGIYMEYSPVYTNGKFTNIKITFKNVAEQNIRRIRYDNPQIVEKVNYEFSNTNTNKATINYGGKQYKIYLREDNNLTTSPIDEYRIKKVINKNIDFTADKDLTTDEIAEAIIVLAQKELQGDVFGYKIEFTMLVNENRPWNYRQACIFTAENKVFDSLVTRIEYLSEKTIRITLGAYRTRLTEKIQKLMKPTEIIGNSLGGISVSNAFGNDLYWFEKDSNGNLYVCSESLTNSQLSAIFELDSNNNLYVNYGDTQRQALSIDSNGNLVGEY